MKIEKIDRMKVSDKVFEQIKTMIITQEWPLGTKIPSETKLGELFGVSRVSIRTALQQLSAIGLVETRNGEGTFVCEPSVSNIFTPLMGELSYSPTDILELMEFRRGIEMQVCRLAAERRTEEDLKEMAFILEKMANYKQNNDIENYTKADIEFHFCIAKMSKNSLFQKVMSILQEFLLAYGKKANIQVGMELGYEKHWQLYELIKLQQAESAEKLMYIKINEVKEAIKSQ